MTTTEPVGEGARAGFATRLRLALARPENPAWLAAFRVLFGLVMAWSVARFLAYGWVAEFWVKPKFHFTYWLFPWAKPLSGAGMHALFWALLALALAMTAGLFFRAAALLFFVGFTYAQLVDVTTYLNHYYLASLLVLLLAASPAGRVASVDAWIARRLRGTAPPAAIAAGWHHLLRLQVGCVYTFAGVAKMHADWLVHAQPLRIWLSAKTDLPVLGTLFESPLAAPAMSFAGCAFDATVAFFLLTKKTRPFAFAAVVVFHAATGALFPIGLFPAIMIVSALVFFDADWPTALLARLRRRPAPGPVATVTEPVARRLASRAATAAFVAYACFQLAMPLRFALYGDDVRWHEQGMRFSWRVMVREKNGSVTFVVRQLATGRTWHVAPSAYLTRIQEREMSGQPDLVLQLAHRIRDDAERAGHGPVAVFADARVSLNGRASAPLVDPNVDLARVRDGLGKATWIAPAPAGPPPRLVPVPAR